MCCYLPTRAGECRVRANLQSPVPAPCSRAIRRYFSGKKVSRGNQRLDLLEVLSTAPSLFELFQRRDQDGLRYEVKL